MDLKYLIIHSTMTKEGKNVVLGDIISNHKDKGFSNVGYSDIIDIDGNILSLTKYNPSGRCFDWSLGHEIDDCSGYIAYIGGINKESTYLKDTRTDSQKETLEIYVKYMIKRHPNIIIAGHNQFNKKPCPSFNVSEWLHEIGVEDKNIYR